MVVTIVEQGRSSLVRSYGVRRMGEPGKVDEHTLFGIGSTTKAFTSALIAMLVDEGKLGWDTKVQDVLPGFKMYDPYVSSEMTVRDLLVHRSGLGLGAGDLLFFPPTDFSRADIVHKLRFIKPASSFRSAFAYDNLLYVVAGQVIEAVSGAPWEEVVRKRILDPLQMTQTTASAIMPSAANRAWPHARVTGEFRGAGPNSPLASLTNLDVAAAAGALNVSGIEIARWLELQLGRGLDPRTNTRLYSEDQAHEMWSAQTLIPVSPAPKGLELAAPNFRAYAIGWMLSDYRGHKIVAHGGGVPGSVTLIVLVPDRQLAFAMMTNSEEVGALAAMQYRLLDHYLGLTGPDWIGAVATADAAGLAMAKEQFAATQFSRSPQGEPAKGPSLPIAQYAGKYRDAWYGLASIANTPQGLTLKFDHTPSLSGKLEHLRYDTFRTRWTDKANEDAYVTFALNPDGSVKK